MVRGRRLLSAAAVVGADAVLEGKAKRAAGIKARGATLVLRLRRANPAFVLTFVLPLFQATPLSLPANREVVPVRGRGIPRPARTTSHRAGAAR